MKVKPCPIFMLILGLCLISAPAISDVVGAWLFEEGKGDVAKDSSGKNHDGIITNCEWDEGINGKGLRFGPTSKMEVPDHEDFHFTDKLTIALWANIEDLPMDHVGIPGKAQDQPIGSFVFHPTKLNAKQYELRFYVSFDNQWPMAKTPNPINFGEWHHLAGTYDGKVISVYVDGKLEGKAEAKGKLNISEGAPLKFTNDCCGGRNLVGVLDEIYILNEVLTEEGIARAKDGLLLSVTPRSKIAISWGMIKNMK